MTIEQIQYFVAIAETGSFSKAAERYNISQSSVTKQLGGLEAEWGIVLLDRNSPHVVLSAAGSELYQRAKQALQGVDALARHAHALSGEARRRIKIVALPFMGQYNLPAVLQSFSSIHPEMELCLEEMEEAGVLGALEKGACDAALVREEVLSGGKYRIAPLTQDRLALFVSKDSPLAGESSIDIGRLKDQRFMFMPPHTHEGKLAVSVCREHGFAPHILQYARPETILGNVESGRCVSLMMEKTLEVFGTDSIRAVPVRPEMVSRVVLAMPSKPGRKQEVQMLAQHMATQLQEKE